MTASCGGRLGPAPSLRGGGRPASPVCAVAVASDGRVTQTLPLSGVPIVEFQDWCDRQRAAGYRTAVAPGEPAVGVQLLGAQEAAA